MSQEYTKNKITEYYRNILCREPDEAGLAYYLKMAKSGTSLEKIREFSNIPVNKLKFFQFMAYRKGGFQEPHCHNVGPVSYTHLTLPTICSV